MKINEKILSIPPYISTSWKNIASLHLENQADLIITLVNGAHIAVPQLEGVIIESIFTAHAKFMEQGESSSQKPPMPPKLPLEALFSNGSPNQVLGLNIPLKDSLPLFENMGALLQHNSEQSQSDNLPPDILNKISLISKNLGIDDPAALPKPEPHCNCPHCQIAKALQADSLRAETLSESTEEIVSEEDLKFRSWDISQTAENLFIVTNPLDAKEQFSVYLGNPVGCTCGDPHCEHIRAVLNS